VEERERRREDSLADARMIASEQLRARLLALVGSMGRIVGMTLMGEEEKGRVSEQLAKKRRRKRASSRVATFYRFPMPNSHDSALSQPTL